jgi:hypothetical protein
MIYRVMTWIIIGGFVAVFTITVLGMIGRVKFADKKWLGRLFSVLVLQVVAGGFTLFNNGFSPLQQYYSKVQGLYDKGRRRVTRNSPIRLSII